MESWDSIRDTVQVTEINHNIQYSTLSFPVGYRFCPTDEELIVHYLCNKVSNRPLPCQKIKDVNLYDYNPEDLIASSDASGKKEWFFFTPRDRKYKNGTRPNRAAGDGYWKATGADKSINSNGKQVGVKKALVFYRGKPPNGEKSMWIMQEFRVSETLDKPRKRDSTSMKLDDWVLCRIYKKPSSKRTPTKDEHPKTTEVMPMPEENLPLINQVDTPKVYEYNQMPQTMGQGESVELFNFPSETIINPISPLDIEYSPLNSWNSNQGEVFNNHLDNNMSMGYGMYDQSVESNPYFSDEINMMASKYFPNALNTSMNEDGLYLPTQESYHLSSQFDAHERIIFEQCNAAFKDEDTDMNPKRRKRFHQGLN